MSDLWITEHGRTSGAVQQQASVKAQDLVNEWQDYLVGSATSQDQLRSVFLTLSPADRTVFEKAWARVLNPADYRFVEFEQACHPQAALAALKQQVSDQREQLDAAIATVTARDRELSDLRDQLKASDANGTRLAEELGETITERNTLKQELDDVRFACDEYSTLNVRLQQTILELKAKLYDLTQPA